MPQRDRLARQYELAPDLIVNLDRGGNVVALEIRHATQRIGRRGLRQIAIDLQGL